MGTVSTYSDPSTDQAVGCVGENVPFAFSLSYHSQGFCKEKTQKRGLGAVFRLADITDHSHLVDPTILPFTVGMLVYVVDVRLFKKFFWYIQLGVR